jgi:LacI family transcriptional regulator
MLGVIISDIVNPFFGEVAQVIQSEAQDRGYQVLVSATQFSTERLNDAVQHMIGMRVDGLAIVTTEMDPSVLDVVKRRSIPVVFEDAGVSGERIGNLVIDYEGGIYRAVRCLVELGHERILFAENYPYGDKEKLFSIRARSLAFEAAVQRYPGIRSQSVGRAGPVFQAGIDIATHAVRELAVTSVVANSDLLALGLLRGFRRCGKNVPGDISIIGFDNLPWCELSEPPLTSVEISRAAIGKAAVESLVSMIENKSPGTHIRIRTELIMRESAGALRPARSQ